MGTGSAREQGFSLIELVMALTLLSVAIFGMASVFASAARTSGVDLHRTTAVGLATRATEVLKTHSYDDLGMADGTTSTTAPACDATATIVVVDSSTAVPASDPMTTLMGVTYSLDRCVTWQMATTGETFAYKGTTVAVRWTDEGGAHLVRQDSSIYPGGRGQYVAGLPTTTTTIACAGTPAAPAAVVATDVDDRTVELAWTSPSVTPVPVQRWDIEYQLGLTGPRAVFSDDNLPAPPGAVGGNVVLVSGLARGSTYQFQVIALAAGCPPSSATLTPLVTTAGALRGCSVGLISLSSPTRERDLTDDRLAAPDVTVNVASNGNVSDCGHLHLDYQPALTPQTSTLTSVAPNSWTGTLPAGTDWTLGDHSIKVMRGVTELGRADFCVYRNGASSC